MPTFARLIAAILLAAVAYYVSDLTRVHFPEERPLTYYVEFNTFVGLIVGWKVIGSRAGNGMGAAIGIGMTGAVAAFINALFFQCFAEMIKLSMKKYYDGAADAVVGIFELMWDYGLLLSTVEIWGATLIGGIIVAMVAEMASKRFD